MLNTDTFGKGPNLCLLHGWGAQNTLWKEWAQETLAPHFTVTLIELPGFGYSAPLELNSPPPQQLEMAWIEAIQAVLPQKTHLLGWSLGGLLAQKVALNYPHQIDKLICLASTPRFTQTDQWSYGVSPQLLSDFIQAVVQDRTQALNHFWKLQLQGTDNAKQHIKQLLAQLKNSTLPSLTGLTQGLTLLKEIDCRNDYTSSSDTIISPPPITLWLLGEKDPLIPAEFIQDFLLKNSTIAPISKSVVLQGAGHMPFKSHPNETANAIIQFLNNEAHD